MPIDGTEEDKTSDEARNSETVFGDHADTLTWESEGCPPKAGAQFRRRVTAYDLAP